MNLIPSKQPHITTKTTDLWRVSREYPDHGMNRRSDLTAFLPQWHQHVSEHDSQGDAIRTANWAGGLGARNIAITGPHAERLS